MLFDVEHITLFRYDRPVLLEPLIVRLRPRCDPSQHPLRFGMEMDPVPDGASEFVDLEENHVRQVWFSGLTDTLTIRTSFTVETLRSNPFDYIVPDPAVLRVPVSYTPEERTCLARHLSATGDRGVEALAAEVLESSGEDAPAFLSKLASRIHGSVRCRPRQEGEPLPPGVTLAERSGACRDLAVLFMDAARSVGIAARFVSGYTDAPDGSDRSLHAWSEVYLPGAGWRGYDPSDGLAAADRHICVAAGATPREAAPTRGTFRGDGATTRLESHVEIRTRSAEAAPLPK